MAVISVIKENGNACHFSSAAIATLYRHENCRQIPDQLFRLRPVPLAKSARSMPAANSTVRRVSGMLYLPLIG